jgi:hypothetical protein
MSVACHAHDSHMQALQAKLGMKSHGLCAAEVSQSGRLALTPPAYPPSPCPHTSLTYTLVCPYEGSAVVQSRFCASHAQPCCKLSMHPVPLLERRASRPRDA